APASILTPEKLTTRTLFRSLSMISRRTWYALSAIAAGMGAAGCQSKASDAELSPADVAAIGAVLDVMPREFKAKNADGVVAAFSSDAVLLEDGRINRGKESILNDHVKPEATEMNVVTFSSNDRTIKGRGGFA